MAYRRRKRTAEIAEIMPSILKGIRRNKTHALPEKALEIIHREFGPEYTAVFTDIRYSKQKRTLTLSVEDHIAEQELKAIDKAVLVEIIEKLRDVEPLERLQTITFKKERSRYEQ